MVPSDPFDSSPTAGMHDLGTAAKRAGRRLLCSPSPLLPETAQSSRARLLTLPSRDRRFLTAFLSPATTSRSPGRHSEVKDPDLPFQHLPDFHQARSEETPLAGRFPVQLPVVLPVAWLPPGPPGRLANLHSPLGLFTPVWIEAFSPFSFPTAHRRGSPASPSLPATGSS